MFLHPFTVSSGRAQGGPALAAFWARVREATGSSSGAAAAAAFFIAALDAFAARVVRLVQAGQGQEVRGGPRLRQEALPVAEARVRARRVHRPGAARRSGHDLVAQGADAPLLFGALL